MGTMNYHTSHYWWQVRFMTDWFSIIPIIPSLTYLLWMMGGKDTD